MSIKLKKNLTLLAVTLAVAVNLLFGYRAFCSEQQADNQEDTDATVLQELDMLISSLQLIRQNYVDGDKISSKDLLYGAIGGLTTRLDPYSVFLPPQANQVMKEETEGAFGGIGVTIEKCDKGLRVISGTENSPAMAAGLLIDDIITAINGENIANLQLEAATQKLRGEIGTTVSVSIIRQGEELPEDIVITRDRITMMTVSDIGLLPDTTIGYFHILQFMEPTGHDVLMALQKLEGQGLTALVIDLRGNPGGLLQTAVEICSYFLPDGQKVVSVEGRNPEKNYVCNSLSAYKFPESIPLVILIDQGSASASEIMSGCLHDLKRATLVGHKSFGKGSVQNIINLGNDCALKLTVAKYYTPGRQVIHGNGIEPDIVQDMTSEDHLLLHAQPDFTARIPLDKQLQKALEYLSVPATAGEENIEVTAAEEEQPSEEDAQ